MKTVYKIMLGNLLIAFVITTFNLITNGGFKSGSYTALVFGLVCLGLALLNLLVGMIMYFANKNEWGRGMLLSFAILLLLSGVSCSQGSFFY